jgi:hypothetical protein
LNAESAKVTAQHTTMSDRQTDNLKRKEKEKEKENII